MPTGSELKLMESAEECRENIAKATNLTRDSQHGNLAVGIINREVNILLKIIRGLMPETQDILAWREIQDTRSKGTEEFIDWLTSYEEKVRALGQPIPTLLDETTKLMIRQRLNDLFQYR